ncbi:MATE family efflux transporter [Prevotella sp. KH2C16]|uniref:MATE family efflux transporter n=1 Tax=Prevotella sp. KH2C16 TaxID=1855325 RepID=UPI0008E6B7A0|nr:MATE family efflux transporter [Prevotella sp. KH2C16]SFG21748.1 multidrug resistance protein, MATE family [Prevotella sp. KH2C16]
MIIDRQILRLAVPSIVSNITVPLLGLVDLAIVGHMGNVRYIAAIAVGSMIFNIIYWLFGFLRMGTSGMASQALGRRNLPELLRLFLRSLSVGLLIALCFLVCQWPLRGLSVMLMHPSAEVVPFVYTYFNICIWGAPAVLGLYSMTGWFVGMQNTRIPMVVSILQNIINIIVSVVLVFGFGLKIEGVAFGTLTAQWSGLLMALGLWLRHYRRLLKYEEGWRQIFLRNAMSRFFGVNRDIFFRTVFLVAVNLFFTSFGARQGDLILSVNTLLLTFYTLFSYVMDGFAFAAEALCGRAYGAGDGDRFRKVCRRLAFWGFLMVSLFTLVYAVGGRSFLGLLTDEASVIDAAMPYFPWALLIPLAGVAAFIYDGIFIGITATRGMLVSSCIAAVCFFAVYALFFGSMRNHALWLSLIVYLLMRGVVQKIYLDKTCRI